MQKYWANTCPQILSHHLRVYDMTCTAHEHDVIVVDFRDEFLSHPSLDHFVSHLFLHLHPHPLILIPLSLWQETKMRAILDTERQTYTLLYGLLWVLIPDSIKPVEGERKTATRQTRYNNLSDKKEKVREKPPSCPRWSSSSFLLQRDISLK